MIVFDAVMVMAMITMILLLLKKQF